MVDHQPEQPDDMSRLLYLREVFGPRAVATQGGVERALRRHSSWVEGLRMTAVLEDHQGCVNCLCWHPLGRELLSSGDDLKIIAKGPHNPVDRGWSPGPR